MAATFFKVLAASAVAGALVGAALAALGGRWHGRLGAELAVVGVGLAAIAALAWAAMKALKVEELGAAEATVAALGRRLRR